MSTVAADPALLDRAAAAQREIGAAVRRDAQDLGDALAPLRAARSEIALPPLVHDEWMDEVATQWLELAEDLGVVGEAFARADTFVGEIRLALALAALVAEPRADDRPWQVDRARVAEATDEVRRALDPGGWGVRGGDLAVIRDTLAGLDGPEADAVVAALTDEELAHWFDQMGEGAWQGGWSASRRRELLVLVGERVSLGTWRRLARFTEEIDPDPRTALPDTARDEPARVARFEALRYEQVDGVLVAAGPGDRGAFAHDDARQGAIGDCYLVAAMQALAFHDPAALEDVVRANPNGTYTVTFGDGEQVVVSADLPVEPDGSLMFARNGPSPDGGSQELWPMLVEKAVAQRAGSWEELVGGSQSDAIELLTGRASSWIDDGDVDLAELGALVDGGAILGLSTIDKPDDVDIDSWRADPDTPEPFSRDRWLRLEQNHAFVVTAIDPAGGTMTVVNPWDPTKGPVVLTEAELTASVNGIRVSAAPEDP